MKNIIGENILMNEKNKLTNDSENNYNKYINPDTNYLDNNNYYTQNSYNNYNNNENNYGGYNSTNHPNAEYIYNQPSQYPNNNYNENIDFKEDHQNNNNNHKKTNSVLLLQVLYQLLRFFV